MIGPVTMTSLTSCVGFPLDIKHLLCVWWKKRFCCFFWSFLLMFVLEIIVLVCECDNFKNVVGALTYVSAVGSLYEYSTTPEFIFIFFKSQCFVNCVVRCRRSPWTRREPVWWRVDTITTYVSGTLPAWTRLCRPSGRCSPVSGESPSENTSSNINTLAWNMWLISFMQTFTTLSVPKCTHTHTNSHEHTFVELHWASC